MLDKLDYNSEEVMKILNNPEYTEEQKKTFFEKYKSDLKTLRKKEIVNEVNELAKKIPIITEDMYVEFLKKYEDDNLSKPFAIINKEIKEFEIEMTEKYNAYLESKRQEELLAQPKEEPKLEDIDEENEEDIASSIVPEVTINKEPNLETTSSIFSDTTSNSVLNEEPQKLEKPLVDDYGEAKDVMPNTNESLGEKGSASAIIISIIAVIIGILVMYTILKVN